MKLEIMLRHDGEYGLSRIAHQEIFVVDESWCDIAGPFLLRDIIDSSKLAAMLPAKIRKELGYDNGQLGPFGP